MVIVKIRDKNHLEEQLEKACNDKLAVVQFSADWCSPCRHVKPLISQYSRMFQDTVVFLYVDSDECVDLRNEYEIFSLPTFLFFKNKIRVGHEIGFKDRYCLESKIHHFLEKFETVV